MVDDRTDPTADAGFAQGPPSGGGYAGGESSALAEGVSGVPGAAYGAAAGAGTGTPLPCLSRLPSALDSPDCSPAVSVSLSHPT